jgi:hypothetical protein
MSVALLFGVFKLKTNRKLERLQNKVEYLGNRAQKLACIEFRFRRKGSVASIHMQYRPCFRGSMSDGL